MGEDVRESLTPQEREAALKEGKPILVTRGGTFKVVDARTAVVVRK